MNSRTILLYSLPIMLLTCNASIANNGSFTGDEISRIIAEANLANTEEELIAPDSPLAAMQAQLIFTEEKLAAAEAKLAASEKTTHGKHSSPWIFIGTSIGGLDYYLDSTSIKKETGRYESWMYQYKSLGMENSYKRAWWKIVKNNGDYSKIQTKFYCDIDFAIDVASANYDVNNNYKGQSYKKNELEPVIPETVFAKLSSTVCNV